MSHLSGWGAPAGALALVVLAGCSGGDGARPARDPAPVRVAVIHAMPAGRHALVLPGRVAAGEEVVVTARIAGRVTALRREGDRFRAGQSLVSFDAAESRDALLAARAALDAARVRSAQGRLQESRMESLFVARVASQRELELAQSERRDAEARLAGARAAVAELSSGLELRAPFDGVVVRRMIDPGVTASPGQPLVMIRSGAPVEVVVAIPEGDLGRLAHGRFEFTTVAGPWRAMTFTRVDGMTDFATRTRAARFHPAGGVPLEPGAFVRVRIMPGGEAAGDASAGASFLSVPVRSLVRRGGLTGVYVVRDGRAALRWLRLGAADGDHVDVLSGLDPGDAIAADPAGLSDGRAVEMAR